MIFSSVGTPVTFLGPGEIQGVVDLEYPVIVAIDDDVDAAQFQGCWRGWARIAVCSTSAGNFIGSTSISASERLVRKS